MIDTEVARFIESKVMIFVATRNEERRPMIGRGSGAWVDAATGNVALLVSSSQWPSMVAWAKAGMPIAITCVRPTDYQAYQIKGMIGSVRSADRDEERRGSRYVAAMLQQLGSLGVTRLQLSSTLSDRDLVYIAFRPRDLYVQTPGPAAGRRITAEGQPQ